MSWSLENYTPVNERILKFKELYPEGSLAPLDLLRPFWIEDVPGVGVRLIYVAAAYRTPDDKQPGIGMAWEPLPGLTPYTKGSELMVAETSAWGRALAAIGIGVNAGIASNEEVQARKTPFDRSANVSKAPAAATVSPMKSGAPEALLSAAQCKLIFALMADAGVVTAHRRAHWAATILGKPVNAVEGITKREASKVIDGMKSSPPPIDESAGDGPSSRVDPEEPF